MTDVVAALIWDGDRFLVCQRPEDKSRALLWEFVGGKVEQGETLKQALIRECMEELAVSVSVQDVFMTVVHEYTDITVRLTLFNANIVQGEPQKLEHNDIRWIKTDEIDAFQFCPADKEILAVLKNLRNGMQARLYANRDPKYREFQSKLIPTVNIDSIIGVRMPVLRTIANGIRSIDELGTLPHRYLEENFIHALLINKLKDPNDTVAALDAFLPFVDNWAVCDALAPVSFRSSPREARDAAQRWLSSPHPYSIRFGIAVLMKYYLDVSFEAEYLDIVSRLRSSHYYVNMMIAWYFATALAKQYEPSCKILENRALDRWTHNKAIQKACESYRISSNQKSYLRTLKY